MNQEENIEEKNSGEKKDIDESLTQMPPFMVPQHPGVPEPNSVFQMMGMAIRSAGVVPDSFAEKITPEHITTILEAEERERKDDYEENEKERRYTFFYVLIGVIVFLIVVFNFKDSPLLDKLITAILGFIGGYGMGYKRGMDE